MTNDKAQSSLLVQNLKPMWAKGQEGQTKTQESQQK
jgi:hypothetical protein